MNQQNQNFSNQEPKCTTPRLVLYILLLFIFPPVGIYLIWRNKACHKWLPHLLLISGGYWLILSIVLLGQWIPALSRMIQEFGIETKILSSVLYVFVIVFILQIISGFLIDKKISFAILTPKNYSVIATIFLCIDFLIFPIAFGSTLGLTVHQSLYQKLGELDSGPIETAIDETANWKVYKNDEYGFEIKYPSTWEIAGEQDLWEERGFLKTTFEGPGKIEKRLVESMGQEEEIIESGAQLIVSYEQGLSYECEGVLGLRAFCCPPECELVEISGKQATKTLKKDVGFIQNNYQWQAEVDSENPFPRRVFFLLRYNPENYLSAEKNFSQILSTLRFLE